MRVQNREGSALNPGVVSGSPLHVRQSVMAREKTQPVRCIYCQWPIVRLRTRLHSKPNMPVEEGERGWPYVGELYDSEEHIAHWGRCPGAREARKKK